MGSVVILGLVVLSLGLSVWTVARETPFDWRFKLSDIPETPEQQAPVFETLFDYRAPSGQAHAPCLIRNEDALSLLWFEGSAEAQADVDVYSVQVNRLGPKWSVGPKQARLTRTGLGQAMDPRQLVVTLGNTVEAGRPGEVLATIVSIGGWAMASVADVRFGSGGPEMGRKLNLSPFLNRSNLVKSPLVLFEDGDRGLPTYFELGTGYSLFARLDAQGRVRETTRLTGPGKPIQPMIVPLDAGNAVAFLRDLAGSGQLLISRSADGGRSWSHAVPAGLANTNSPVAALLLEPDQILVAANDDPTGGNRLSLLSFRPSDGVWHHLRELETGDVHARYPVLRHDGEGAILLTYSTYNKTGLRLHHFTRSWAEAGDA
ncbi:MAG: exo-alpha-sialidase [Pseudomonadota bacterium]